MKRNFFRNLIVLCLALAVLAVPAMATETAEETEAVRAPDQCGEALTWSFADGVLTITGSGAMDDFPDGAPWQEHREQITTVVLSGAVTYIGDNAFLDHEALEAVDFGLALTEIGDHAFQSCDGLTTIALPETFRVFGEESFRGCKNLTQIHCGSGRFPSFRLNCFWDTYVKIYFPAENPWPLVYIEQLETAFQGRVEFLASDGSDPYVPTEPTEETTEPTEETTEPTEETTEPTEETTEPTERTEETAEPTEPTETQVPETEPAETEPQETPAPTEETEPPAEEKQGVSGIALWIIGGVLVFTAAGFLIFGRKSKGGKFAR